MATLVTTPKWMARAPHALSFARVVLVIAIYFAAARLDRPLFAVLVLLAVLTDILDGPLARATNSASTFGANVDSTADMLFYISLPAWAFMFDSRLVLDNLAVIVTIATLYVVANIVSQWTFGALGVHNRLSRASGTMGVVVTFYAILWGLHPVLFWAALVVVVLDLSQRYGAVFRELRARMTTKGEGKGLG